MTAELALLRLVVRGDVDDVRQALSDPATDVARFLRFAHGHQLGAFCYWSLQRLGLTRHLAPRLLAAAKASSLRERVTIERLVLLLRDLGELFEQGGASVLFIKGPLFAQRFYGSVEARGVSDLDVLIRAPGDLAQVEALLLGNGFTPAFRVPLSRRLSRFFAHHFEYRRDGLPLDVHWALQAHFTFAIDYPRIWSTSSLAPLAGRAYPTTSDEYELVLRILGIVTDLQVGKLGLRSIVDTYRVLKTVHGTLDWREFFACRERERILRPSVFVLALVLDVLDCGDEFPALRSALQGKLGSLPPTSLAHRAALDSRPLDLRQKMLALRIYETPLVASIAWWFLSLPFRLAVYGVTRTASRRLDAPAAPGESGAPGSTIAGRAGTFNA